MDLHKAIRAIHNSVATIDGSSQDDIVAIDKDGNEVSINWTSVNSWTDPDQYKFNREAEYPSIQEQLDMLWHSIDQNPALKSQYFHFYEAIKAVKVKNPK